MEWEQEVALFLDNELPPGRRARLEGHLSQCAACSRFSHALQREERLLAGHIRHEAREWAPDEAFTQGVMNAVRRETAASGRNFSAKPLADWFKAQIRQSRWQATAAVSLLICAAGALAAVWVGNVEAEQFVTVKRNGDNYPARTRESFFVRNENGEFFEFPDGSVVYATQNTWFIIQSYPKMYESSTVGAERRLELKFGELFLHVKPANEGFSVVCANAAAKVFGTQFYISFNRGEYKRSFVGVREGRVLVEKRNQKGYTVLGENQCTRVSGLDEKIVMDTPFTISSELRKQLNQFNMILLYRLYESRDFDPGIYELDGMQNREFMVAQNQ